jgi:hypothetical protein
MLMVGNLAGAGVNYESPTLAVPAVEVADAAVSEVTLHRL